MTKKIRTEAVMVGALLVGLMSLSSEVRFLERPEGRVAYEDLGGAGPLVVCVPGMGDLRSQYRLIGPRLVAAGFHVIAMDLRGMGDSSTGFTDHSAAAVGSDVVALIKEQRAEHAFILGNSMAAASAVWAAAELPDVVDGIAVTGPFVRDVPGPAYMGLLVDVLFRPPWGTFAWGRYYRTLYPVRPPADLDAHVARIQANLSAGHKDALIAMLHAKKTACEARIPDVKARALVIMGTQDPDFPKPDEEASLVAKMLHGKVLMVDGAGHYPHVDSVDVVTDALIPFLKGEDHGNQSRVELGADRRGSSGTRG